MELLRFEEPDLPESLRRLESLHWQALSTLYWRSQDVADPEVVSCLEAHDLVRGGELTELGKLAYKHQHEYLGEWDYEKDGKTWKSCAVVASDGTHEVVLHTYGPAIDWHVDEYGLDNDMLELDPPGPGVWIWTGSMGSVKVYYHEFGDEWEHQVTGDWRTPTAAEWESIKDGECPWDKENLPRWDDD